MAKDTVTQARAYTASQKPPELVELHEAEAHRKAMEEGDLREASKSTARLMAHRQRLSLARRREIALEMAERQARATLSDRERDCLLLFPRGLAQAGFALRDHFSGMTSFSVGDSPSEIKEFVEGGGANGKMEALIDRRRTGRQAWRHAEEAIDDLNIAGHVRIAIEQGSSMKKLAERIYGKDTGHARSSAKEHLRKGLEGAARFLGMVD